MNFILPFFIVMILGLSLSWGQASEDSLDDDEDLEVLIDRTAIDLQQPLAASEANRPPADSLLDNSLISNMMGDVLKSTIMEYIKQNPFSKMSQKEVEDLILNNVKGRPAEQVFKNSPRLFAFVVDWLRDPKAIPAFLGIVNKVKQLKTYGIAVFVVFIISFALNMFNSKGGLLRRLLQKLLIMLGSLAINLGIFYFLFTDEIRPTIDVFIRSFFG